MGTRTGHVAPGLVFLAVGLWQLFNNVKLHLLHPHAYRPPIWFPARGVRYLELYFVILASGTYIILELFFANSRHHPLDPVDWTIPTNHLHNFEHVTISLGLFTYAAFALYLDRMRVRAGDTICKLLGALAFGVELLVFHVHSPDHAGVEWQYHFHLQLNIAVCMITTAMGIGFPTSFAVGFVRSVSVVLQGSWYMVLGVMLYTPRFIPKGCTLQSNDGQLAIPCSDQTIHRAMALVNLQFAWLLIAVVAFSVWFYLQLAKTYEESPTPKLEAIVGKYDGEDHLCESGSKMNSEKKPASVLNVDKLIKIGDFESKRGKGF